VRGCLACVFSALCLCVPASASDWPSNAIVVTEPALERLVASGYERSETLRHVTSQVTSSGWTVFILSGPCPMRQTTGCLLHTVGRFEGRPYLRIKVQTRDRHGDSVIATVAHELQHALEVVSSGEVRDTGTLVGFFKRLDRGPARVSGGTIYETRAARAIENQVERELRSSR